MKKLDFIYIRYLNLLEKIARVKTINCFSYDSSIIYAVPQKLMSKAIGDGGKNVRKLSEVLGKRVKIIPMASGRTKKDIEKFIAAVVHPVEFRGIEIDGKDLAIVAGMNKAMLIGRNKTRLGELKDVLKQYFDIENVKIV
ncbi:NusA-like transcription termination signal-binding factor [Candidatus Woesearchaeota archaeon CG10_big_fil_rev_8_21_14_0_10_34_12]|nr:MAG: NusA-like transcription termination signal-binding factor [Candidatus Woesearchaeota archaeon CG10_big_fil_rev_8_21_14_0_10_34_12]